MVKWILSAALAIFCRSVSAQQQRIDSLNRVLALNSKADSFRMNALIELSGLTFTSNPGEALAFADEAIAIAKRIYRPDKLAEAYTNKGNSYWAKGSDGDAKSAYLLAFDQYKRTHNDYGQAKVYNNLGLLSFNQGEYSKALQYHMDALPIFTKLKHYRGIANSYNNAGVVVQYLGDYSAALDFYLKALRIFEEHPGNPDGLANAYTNVGIIYKNIQEYDKSLSYYQKALSQYHQSNNKQGIANLLGNIGNIYSLINQIDTSLSYYKRALVLNQSIGNNRRIASDLSNIGAAYAAAGDFASSIRSLEDAKDLYEEMNDKNSLSTVLSQLAEVYSKAPSGIVRGGLKQSQRNSLVDDYYKQAIHLATEIGAIDRQSEIYLSLSNLYEKTGEHRAALEAFRKHAVLRDSLLNDKKQKEIVRKEIQFGFDQKEAILKKDMETERFMAATALSAERVKLNIGLAAAIILIALGSLIVFLYKKRRDAEEQKRESDLKAQIAETEMKALRSQMNPHFIYNSLNSISDYIDKQQIGTATAYIAKFAKLMRMILEHSEQQEVSLADDLHALELYMQLEAYRSNNKFTYEMIVSDDIDKETTLVPPMILQPFVENSIWHGVLKADGQGKINIRISKHNNMLRCIVEDNGAGRKDVQNNKPFSDRKSSFGLKITQSRIDLLNRLKKAAAGFVLTDLEKGLRVEVNLPYQSAF